MGEDDGGAQTLGVPCSGKSWGCGFMVGQPGMMTGLQEDRGAMPLIRHREEGQADLCGFQVSLVYRANSRTARATQ